MSEAFRQEPPSFLDRLRDKKLADAEEEKNEEVSTGIEVKESTGPMLVIDNTKSKQVEEVKDAEVSMEGIGDEERDAKMENIVLETPPKKASEGEEIKDKVVSTGIEVKEHDAEMENIVLETSRFKRWWLRVWDGES